MYCRSPSAPDPIANWSTALFGLVPHDTKRLLDDEGENEQAASQLQTMRFACSQAFNCDCQMFWIRPIIMEKSLTVDQLCRKCPQSPLRTAASFPGARLLTNYDLTIGWASPWNRSGASLWDPAGASAMPRPAGGATKRHKPSPPGLALHSLHSSLQDGMPLPRTQVQLLLNFSQACSEPV